MTSRAKETESTDYPTAREEGRHAASYLLHNAPLSGAQLAWLTGLLETLLRPESTEIRSELEFGATMQTSEAILVQRPAERSKYTYSAETPFAARIEQVTPSGLHANTVWQLVLNVHGVGLIPRPGTLLGLVPSNDADHVRNLLRRLRVTGQERVSTPHGTLAVWQALLERFSVNTVSAGMLELFSAHGDPSDAEELRQLALTLHLDTSDILGVLRRFPSVHPPLDEFVNQLVPLVPMRFHIAATLRNEPRLMEVVVTNRGANTETVAEKLEGGQLSVGKWLPIFFESHPEGRLPEDPANPVILFAPGVAAASAAFFLAERAQTRGSGRNWLFTSAIDDSGVVLYEERFHAWQVSRLLTRFNVVASPSVASLVTQDADMLSAWILDGSYVYFFGSAEECHTRLALLSRCMVAARSTDPVTAHAKVREMRSTGQLRVVVIE